MNTDTDAQVGPGIVVLTLAVLAIVMMVSFHLINHPDISSTSLSISQAIEDVGMGFEKTEAETWSGYAATRQN